MGDNAVSDSIVSNNGAGDDSIGYNTVCDDAVSGGTGGEGGKMP